MLLRLQFEIFFSCFRAEVFRLSDFQVRNFAFLPPKSNSIITVTVMDHLPFSFKICPVSFWLSWLEHQPCYLRQQQSHSTVLLFGNRQWTTTLTISCLCAHASSQGQAYNIIGVHFMNVICVKKIIFFFPIYLVNEKCLLRSQALPPIFLLQAALSFKLLLTAVKAKRILTPLSYIFRSNLSSHLTHYI